MEVLMTRILVGSPVFALSVLLLGACAQPAPQSSLTPGAAEAQSTLVGTEETEVFLPDTQTSERPVAPSPEHAEALTPPPATLREAGGLRLRRLLVARSVADHEPVAPSRSFSNEAVPLYAFVDVANHSELEKTVVVTFERPDGQGVGHVTLEIPPKRTSLAYVGSIAHGHGSRNLDRYSAYA